MTRVFALGDVVGRAGRHIFETNLSRIRETYKPDIILLNGENLAGGFGITKKIYHQYVDDLKVDCITTGNHWHDQKEMIDYVNHVERLILPANMENVSSESLGFRIIKSHSGIKFAALNFLGRVFMKGNNRSPFEAAARLIERIPSDVKVRIADVHAETTSEKQAMMYFLKDKVSLVYGTHSHVPTADERITEFGSGFVTDVGMTGAYDSIIGMDRQLALKRLLTGSKDRLEPASGSPWLCAIVADIDSENGRCHHIERVQWRS